MRKIESSSGNTSIHLEFLGLFEKKNTKNNYIKMFFATLLSKIIIYNSNLSLAVKIGGF
jgi:hypothetical protein